jgi:ADP-heptose:LPS heptosyltransferase
MRNPVVRLFPPRRVQRILLILLLPIGDTLFATPMLRAVRRRFPAAHITALVFPTNASVIQTNPDVDEVVVHPTRQTFDAAGYVRLLWSLRRRRFNLSIELRPYSWWLSLACGVWRRLSLDIPLHQWLLPIGRRPWKERHAISSYASIVDTLGLTVDESRLTVPTTDADRVAVGEMLAARGIAPGDRIIALHPGGEGFRGMKRWEAARFAALGDALIGRHGARVVIVGGADEARLAAETAAAMRYPAMVLNGLLSLCQTVALLERCMLFVGNDSAPLHMAGSLGIATVGVFGPTSLVNYRPVGPCVEIARSDLACSPCFHFVGSHPLWAGSRCRVPSCLHALPVDAVLDATARALSRAGVNGAMGDERGAAGDTPFAEVAEKQPLATGGDRP